MILENNLIDDLAFFAKNLKYNLIERDEPLVIEFAGTPRAGKTLCIRALKKFFLRNNITVSVIHELAEDCPIKNKGSNFLFNVDTGTSTLVNFIRLLDQDNHPEVILIDRGIFDSLVWFNFHLSKSNISPSDFKKIENFLLINTWAKKIDIVAVLKTSPKEALRREYKDQITDVQGTIMNEATLLSYNRLLENCQYNIYSNYFTFSSLDTTNIEPVYGVTDIAFNIMRIAHRIKDVPIAYIPTDLVNNTFGEDFVINDENKINAFFNSIFENIRFNYKNDIEEDNTKTQLIPVSIFLSKIKHRNEILFFEIRGKGQNNYLEGKNSIWAGGHIRKADLARDTNPAYQLFRRTIMREVYEELRYSMLSNLLSTKPIAIVRDPTNDKSKRHLGIIFSYNLPSKDYSYFHRSERRELEGKALFSEFHTISDLEINSIDNIEFWSAHLLNKLYGIDIQHFIQSKLNI